MTNSLPPSPAYLADLEPYQSARSLCKGDTWIRMDAGECPTALPFSINLPSIAAYPDPAADDLRTVIASRSGLTPNQVIATCGIDELLQLSVLAFSAPEETIVGFAPTFYMYKNCAQSNGRNYQSIPLNPDFSLDLPAAKVAAKEAAITILCTPNNPTGTVLDRQAVEEIIACAGGLVILDEAYAEFCEAPGVDLIQAGVQNCLVARTFSKAYAAAGIRLGYGLAAEPLIKQLQRVKLPYNVNSYSQAIGAELMKNPANMCRNVAELKARAQNLAQQCTECGCTVSDSVTHFFLLQLPTDQQTTDFYTFLRDEYQILVRPYGVINGRESLRVSTGTDEQNTLFVKALDTFLISNS